MSSSDAEQSGAMPRQEEVGLVEARRKRLGMSKVELAQEAGISRDTLTDLEAGTKRPYPETVAKVVAALDRIEHEVGLDAEPLPGVRQVGDPADDLYEITISDGTYSVTVKGRPRDAQERDEIAASAVRALRETQGGAEHEKGRIAP